MKSAGRYLRLYVALGRFSLATEMAYRANFFVRIVVELLWLGILLAFYRLIFDKTQNIAGWSQDQYLFFIGCHYALGGVIDTFFLENCTELTDLVRSGDLDHFLLKPIDEQFLVTCRRIDWATMPNIALGIVFMGLALWRLQWVFDPVRIILFLLLSVAAVALAYSFLLMLCSTALWFVRNQSLMELWWLFTTLMRHPREIFQGQYATPLGRFFTFVVPILLVVSVPAGTMVKALEPGFVALTLGAGMLLLVVSRWFFRFALRSYRSASS